MVVMRSFPVIQIAPECDSAFAEAVTQFQERWGPFSAAKGIPKKWHLDRLVEELIDPVFAPFAAASAGPRQGFILGGSVGFTVSRAIKLAAGYKGASQIQHLLLRAFLKTIWTGNADDKRFVATLETLLDLLRACCRKVPKRPALRGEEHKARRLNRRRIAGYCRFCGNLAEISALSEGNDSTLIDDPEERLRWSTFYCSAHRPKLKDGRVNPDYRRAKRSLAQFELELERLSRQAAAGNSVLSQSGDPVIDCYYYRYVRAHDLWTGDEAGLRQHARHLTDANISDRKKQILILERAGLNQSEIALRLSIRRQAVSKALMTVAKDFRHLPLPTWLPSDYSICLQHPPSPL